MAKDAGLNVKPNSMPLPFGAMYCCRGGQAEMAARCWVFEMLVKMNDCAHPKMA